jgi:hypothetical protein
MGKKSRFTAITVLVLLIALPLYTSAQLENGNGNRKVYENKIDQIIAACSEKSEMANSKHPNISKIGALAIKKSNFCQNNKQQLIDEMIKANLNPKSYKVNYYVNSKFFELESIIASVDQKK